MSVPPVPPSPAILKQLGIINSTTRLAGTSGGAATAALTCADVPFQTQFSNLQAMATACRPTTPACQGFLDKQVDSSLSAVLPANAGGLCSGRLWVSLTQAKPDGQPDTNVLYGSKWSSTQEITSAVRLSAYIPGVSGPSATLKLAQLPRNGAANRVRLRCEVTGRPRGNYRKFKLCRNQLRELASKGQIPGVVKASW